MDNNSTYNNKVNNYLSSQLIEHKKRPPHTMLKTRY